MSVISTSLIMTLALWYVIQRNYDNVPYSVYKMPENVNFVPILNFVANVTFYWRQSGVVHIAEMVLQPMHH